MTETRHRWLWLVVAGAALSATALGTYFAQDDFGWLRRATRADPTPFWAPRFLSMHLWFRALTHAFAFSAPAFHIGLLALATLAGMLIFLTLARHLDSALAAAAALLFVTSPILFVALRWASATSDLMCAVFLFAALWLATAPGASTGRRIAALMAFALALWSKEVAIGAAPIFLWLELRGPRRSALRAALFLALAIAEAILAVGPWRVASGGAYAVEPGAVFANAPRYLTAAAFGAAAARWPSEEAWSRLPWVTIAGWSLALAWLAALIRRRSVNAWLAAAWFALLLAPVLSLKTQFYFYYATCALPGFWASAAFLATPREPGRRRRWPLVTALVLALVQIAGAQVRERAKLESAALPADFVLRRTMIARNVLAAVQANRERIGPLVAVIGQQPVPSASGGMSTTPATNYQLDPYWDRDIRDALGEGAGIRLVAPQVQDVIFPRWIGGLDTARTIVQCDVAGHARVMSFEQYAQIPPLDSADPLRSHIGRASRLIELRMFPDAARELALAGQLAPADPTIALNLGTTLAALGDSTAAREALERGLALAPRDVDVRFNLGVLYWTAGEEARARRVWEPVLREAPDSDLAARIRAVLAGRARL